MPFRLALAILPISALFLAAGSARSQPALEPPAAVAEDAEPAEQAPRFHERVLLVRRGDTLGGLLASAGVDAGEAHAALTALAPLFPPSALRPGDEVGIRLSTDETPTLLEIELEPQPGRTVRVLPREGRGWHAEESLTPRQRFVVRAGGTVDGGLFPAMTRAGLPGGLALSLIRVLGHQVDFQRDLQPGDRFAILFERYRDGDGDILGHGQILRAEFTLSGRTLAVWRHKDGRGHTDWYDSEGRSLRRTFLRTPLDGARVTSRFGMRSHPALGFNRMHQGIDFGAPTGTPIYAAADGVVVSAKREGGYGLMVRLRHASGVETRYAHMSRFGRGITSGRRVRQGDVIGAVGSTGLSTGPHLHYEVIASGRPVNPARHVQQTVRLAGQDLAAFRTGQRQLDRLLARLGAREEVAMAAD
ncbi:M23 family metallopeptidase [Neoroseomonas soli]|uniref:M23 family metallopeptidase n=1 Tax=Neoroseomonas soli TaxID=1081025 RepID=A0A9X9WZM1_9PROT|nr:M23 family metallopeptidase [Neoroseomonas soli]MBR0672600.1 M23 family metallopeptidase [Neoroseomonas soli]